jgi:hypothetical protein
MSCFLQKADFIYQTNILTVMSDSCRMMLIGVDYNAEVKVQTC